jgi:AcrR family transcriptional regulator
MSTDGESNYVTPHENVPASKDRNDAPESASTVERALSVVGDILDQGGEASLRLADVSRRSGVSVGSLYHHFGSREGLVSAARERQFRLSLPPESEEEIAYLLASSNQEMFLERFEELMERSDSPERSAGRRRRFEMIGAAAGRPGHLGGIVGPQTNYLDRWEQLVRDLQERKWLRDDVDARAFALFLHSASMARVLAEVDEQPVDTKVWRHLVRQTLACLSSERGHMARAS